jgi:hypothetical protein
VTFLAMSCLADLAPSFNFVVHKGLKSRTRDAAPDAQPHSASLVMVGAPFSLRIERDNEQVFVHAGNPAVGWHRLEHVLEFIDIELPPAPGDGPARPEVLAPLLESRWDAVAGLFRNRHRIAALGCFALRRSAAQLQQYFHQPV